MSLDRARPLFAAVLLAALAVGCGEGELSTPQPETSTENVDYIEAELAQRQQ